MEQIVQIVQPAQLQITRWAVSVADYHRMYEAGILGEDDRVELINGEIRLMSPITPGHASVVKRYIALLAALVGKSAIISVQDPVQLDDKTEPQPDLALLRYREDFYANATPTAADVLLIIEVSDTTLAYDRLEKLPRYAKAGIPEVWITDSEGKVIEKHTDPQGNQYATKQTLKRGQSITIQALPAISLSTDSIFG